MLLSLSAQRNHVIVVTDMNDCITANTGITFINKRAVLNEKNTSTGLKTWYVAWRQLLAIVMNESTKSTYTPTTIFIDKKN